jgi:hypothetical protein
MNLERRIVKLEESPEMKGEPQMLIVWQCSDGRYVSKERREIFENDTELKKAFIYPDGAHLLIILTRFSEETAEEYLDSLQNADAQNTVSAFGG